MQRGDISPEMLENWKCSLRDAGVKATRQRLEIYLEIAGATNHPDAETVFRGVQKRIPTISLDTVYRTLWLYSDLGLIGTVGTPQERARFDGNTAPHHHFICVKCGHTEDFISPDLDTLHLPDAVRQFGEVRSAQVEVKGICKGCANPS